MRPMNAAMLAALASPIVRPIVLVELDFESAPVRVHSWIGPIEWDDGEQARTFIGVGALGGISTLEQAEEIKATDVAFSLSGIDSALAASVLGEQYQGRQCQIWYGVLDADERTVVGAVRTLNGLMDDSALDLGEVAEITINARNIIASWETARPLRYSAADQARLSPGDTFCDRIAVAAESEVNWTG